MKRLFAFATVLLLAAPAWADFWDGLLAYGNGDYETVFCEWQPLADQPCSELGESRRSCHYHHTQNSG